MHIDHYSFPVYDKNNGDNTLKETELFKEVPYLSARLGEQAYEYSGGDISNYHLSIQYIMDVLADQAKGKVDLSHFSSEETLSSHVSLEKNEHNYHCFNQHASTVYHINNNDFGRTLVDLFEQMNNSGENVRALKIDSSQHSMAARLYIKDTEQGRRFVVNFYDPNITDKTVRCEVDDALKLNGYSLRNFISSQTYLSSYVDAEISSIIVCDQADIHDQHKVKENRALTPLLQSSPLPLSVARLDLLLTDNFAADIQTMAEEVKNLSESERNTFFNQLLQPRAENDLSGLQCAFNYQCFDALEAYSALLVLVPPEQRTDLLTGKSENGWSSLAQAMSSGNSDMVSVCFYLLQWLPLDEVDKLVFPLAESLPLDDMCTLWEQYADFMQQQSNSLVKDAEIYAQQSAAVTPASA
ncbi:ShET2/EspL2 family type III secretion system effector toxin [Yersinia pseudotuberculosis]|uniref:ShET2/EspL2 family type III secretion system effector toxin n=1 Tax=Yersinia pseudotuberculosis TaxID=633 RepID=UPI0005DFA7C9|nr:ShET2/EspL2 family type III secretion system effector toxin [Yersinia pseudotuberculosis]CND19282.1 ShET2 enterotoxin [Yersinia pseudotuberculosis]